MFMHTALVSKFLLSAMKTTRTKEFVYVVASIN